MKLKFTSHPILAILFFLLFIQNLNAQNFEIRQSLDFLGIQAPKAEIVDLNNDSKLDLFVRGEDINGEIQYLVLSRTSTTDSVFNVFPVDLIEGNLGAFTFSDLNNDNFMDLIISGKNDSGLIKSILYHGKPDFEFLPGLELPDFDAKKIRTADLDNDGYKEIVWQGLDKSGAVSVQVLSTQDGSLYEVVPLTIPALNQGDLIIFDFDKNDYADLFFQGIDEAGTIRTVYLTNSGNFNFNEVTSGVPPLSHGSISIADYDADGFGDLLLHGINEQGTPSSLIYINDTNEFIPASASLMGIGAGQALFADLNHDGRVDVSLNGMSSSGGLMRYVYLQQDNGDLEFINDLIPEGEELSQLFGDFYFDGNLDLVQWKLIDNKWVFEFYQNAGLTENIGPSIVSESYAIQTFDDVKLFWSGAQDDNTPVASLSHDVYIGENPGTSNNASPSFDLKTLKRLQVRHGDHSFNTQMNIIDLAPNIYYYGIQAIDNSFHATCADGNIPIERCFVVCDPLQMETITACIGEEVDLPMNGSENAWYSTALGHLGLHTNLSYQASGPDTLFYSTPGNKDCSQQGAIIINIFTPDMVADLEDIEICESLPVALEYSEMHDSIRWTILNSGETSINNPWELIPDSSTQIAVQIFVCGFEIKDTISVTVIPAAAVEVTPEIIEIFLGDSVQLFASGASTYNWSPAEGLNQTDIANPIATPTQTTSYTVMGSINTGCDDTSSATIIVYNFQNLPDLEPCPAEQISLLFPYPNDEVEWKILSSGTVSSDNPFVFAATEETEVSLRVEIGSLIWYDTIRVAPLSFNVEVAEDTLYLFEGEQVVLQAMGAESYVWSPTAGLSQTDIENPIATPDETTTYTVTGTNANGCIDEARVYIEVKGGANLFIPTLFTPNNDNQNDIFKVYGTALPTTLEFTIFNRSGNQVYRSTKIDEVISTGWDGTYQLVPQPPGIYYWVATGAYPDGSTFLYNGKRTGSIHLLR